LQYEFNILSEISPKLFGVSGDCQATEVSLDYLETSLAGTVFLIEHDGRYGRFLTWLWRYGLSGDSFNTFRVEVETPNIFHSESSFWFVGGTLPIKISQRVLERKWSGRFYIIGHRKQRLLFFSYLWQDIQTGFTDSLSCWKRHWRHSVCVDIFGYCKVHSIGSLALVDLGIV
jgi:hypothetical protein